MFDQYTAQLQNSLMAANRLIVANVKAVEKLVNVHAELFNGILEDSLASIQEGWSNRDIASAIQTQKTYTDSVHEKLMSAAKETYSVVAVDQEQVNEILQGVFTLQAKAAAVTPAGFARGD